MRKVRHELHQSPRIEARSCQFVPFVSHGFRHRQRGTVILVSLCFVAVLGIMLAGYLAVCSRVMTLSNRGFQTDLSMQLAHAGRYAALRAFNKNDWSDWTSAGMDVNWTVDTANDRAIATISFPSSKFGQGVTAQVKIRVDNYDALTLGNTWQSTTTYQIGDLVGQNGIWYRCLQSNSGNAPNLSPGKLEFWAPEPVPWTWRPNTNYVKDVDIVCYNGSWRRCTTSHTSGSTFSWANFATWVPAPQLAWTSFTSYNKEQYVYYSGTWYRCIVDHWAFWFNGANWEAVSGAVASTFYPRWAYRTSVSYQFNDIVYHNGVWYRYNNGTPTAGVTPGSDSNYWENAFSGSAHAWLSTGIKYNIGDTVYHSATNQWYRCILAHTSSAAITPTSTTYWSNTPPLSLQWKAGPYYVAGDVVTFNGVWYRCIQTHTSSTSITPTNINYWIGANTSDGSHRWNSTTAYSVGSYRCFGGVWYRCLVANTGQSPNNTTYWTPTWTQSTGVTTGAPVAYAEATITLGDGTTSRTQLRGVLTAIPLFPNAVAATGTITANSGGTIDSYDSSIGAPSATQYSSQVGNTSTNYSAVVASEYSAGTAITLSSAAVRGYLAAPSSATSPYAPMYTSGGTVKGPTASIPNIDLTRISRSPYVPKLDPLPRGGLATNWATTPKGISLQLSSTVNIGTPGATTPTRYYYNGNLTIGGASIRYLNINGPVILYINGNLSITNSSSIGRITIASTGSAEIHIAGRFMADAGGEGILNQTYDPHSLIIICDTTSASSHFYSEGVNPLYGAIYIPNSTSSTGYYNDNNSAHIYGAVSANKITYSGANMNIHYDTSLRYATFGGVDQPYTVSQWRELDASELATMP
jgi:hypothetical protein